MVLCRYSFYLGIICLVVTLPGCGGAGPDIAEYGDTNIEKVRNMYGLFMSSHGFVGPKNKEELKKFLSSDARAKLLMGRTGLEIEKFEDYFIGERDGEEFKIRWGLKGQLDHAVVFEAAGEQGKRFIALGDPIEVEENEYERYWAGKIKPAGPGSAEDLAPDADEQEQALHESNE